MRRCSLAFMLLVGLCTLAPLRAADAPGRAARAGLHPLWRVEGKSNVVYLLGTVHLLKESDYPLAAPIEAAFTNSAVAVFETDESQIEAPATQMKLLTKGRLPEGETLKSVLSPEVYAGFNRRLTNAGLPSGVFDSYKPSMACVTLMVLELQGLGADPKYAVDRHFFVLAQAADKKIVPLETMDFQIDLLMEMTKEEGELMMKSTLKEMENTEKYYSEMVTAWRTGDAPKMEALLNEAMRDSPALYKRMVTDRTQKWLPKIEELLRGDKNAIVIVGAGHLVGKEGLVELLRANGWKITQL